MSSKIRVGIIGTGAWARYGHIPVLEALDGFEVVALAGRNLANVQRYADRFGIAQAYGSPEELVADLKVDLVVVLAPSPDHGRLARLAITAGKDVYAEWPLSTTTRESQELLELARATGVQHVIGLQRRFSPSSRYWRDLIADGYVGPIRAVHMAVGVDAFGATMPAAKDWTTDEANFTHVLSIYGGHFNDMLFHGIGLPEKLTAVVENQLPVTTMAETGERIPYSAPNAVMAIGTLASGGLFSIQIEGGQTHKTGLHIEITGTEGVLRINNARGFENAQDNTVSGMHHGETAFAAMPVPATYAYLPVAHLDASAQDVAYLYTAYARDRQTGSSEATSFADAVLQHRLIDEITRRSKEFFAR